MADCDFQAGKHFHTRASGQLWIGPIRAVGADPRVMELTVHELQFPSSLESERFLDCQRRKLMNKRDLIRSRRMKLRSVSSD